MIFALLFIIAAVLVDLAVRYILQAMRRRKLQREREEALAESLKLDFTREAKSLKRVEVPEPVARILCVDDEEIVLGSFRKILVLDGYSVDTVETGQEALGLVQVRHYDFVFTDLRMPAMDGVDVVKAVKHTRPDIDVIIITGYATVETAVECMKYGAMDYVQKPFTEQELRGFVKQALIKRKDRLDKQLKPQIHVTHMGKPDGLRTGEFSIPGGVFISSGHCWAGLTQDGAVRIGIDDFAKKLIGPVDGMDLPNVGMTVHVGQPLFSVTQNSRRVQFHSPVGGRVVKVNAALNEEVEKLDVTPYHPNWVCVIDGDDLDAEIPALKIGKSAVTFFQDDIRRFLAFMSEDVRTTAAEEPGEEALCIGALSRLSDDHWERAAREFFGS